MNLLPRALKGVAGLLLIALGLALAVKSVTTVRGDIDNWLADSVTVRGRVVAVEVSGFGRSAREIPVVAFVTAAGEPVRFTAHTQNSSLETYLVGDEVPVRYDPAHPEIAKIDTTLRNWGPLVIVMLVGIVLIGLGLWLAVKTFRFHQSAQSSRENPSGPVHPAG